MKIKKFAQFESVSHTEVEDAIENLENMVKEPFMVELYGENPEYDTDSDTQRGPEGSETIVWIEMKDISEELVNKLEVAANYDEFAAPFEEWAKQFNYYPIEILSTADTVSYQINLG